ncbi:hypothetical protein [Novosphingobium colocasiae]|uniref:hypothetical protein n=1 Tax=Novosphingobium colocasiae TaxID=1256513 RepID=UPI001679E3C5|nr:hypothetical protein [Novosphingobium colocasiae]
MPADDLRGIWSATSEAPTSEVSADEGFVDFGWLRPPASVQLDEDIVQKETGQVIAPKGMHFALVQNSGFNPTFCAVSWPNFDYRDKNLKNIGVFNIGFVNCFEDHGDSKIRNLTRHASKNVLLLNKSKILGQSIKLYDDVNEAKFSVESSKDYFKDIKFGVYRVKSDPKKARVCFRLAAQVSGARSADFFNKASCVPAGLRFNLLGGEYRVVESGGKYAVVVEKGFDLSDARLDVVWSTLNSMTYRIY